MKDRRSFLNRITVGIAAVSFGQIFIPRFWDSYKWKNTTAWQCIAVYNPEYFNSPLELDALANPEHGKYFHLGGVNLTDPTRPYGMDLFGPRDFIGRERLQNIYLPGYEGPHYLAHYDKNENRILPFTKKWVKSTDRIQPEAQYAVLL